MNCGWFGQVSNRKKKGRAKRGGIKKVVVIVVVIRSVKRSVGSE